MRETYELLVKFDSDTAEKLQKLAEILGFNLSQTIRFSVRETYSRYEKHAK